jgi:hypothetical protein
MAFSVVQLRPIGDVSTPDRIHAPIGLSTATVRYFIFTELLRRNAVMPRISETEHPDLIIPEDFPGV